LACPPSVRKSLLGLDIGILLCGGSNPFWVENARGYEELASSFGFRGDIVFPEPEGDPDSQRDYMFEMIGHGYDALIVNPLTMNNLVPAVSEASKRGIPVFDVGAKCHIGDGDVVPQKYVPVRTVDFYEQGKKGGEYLADLMDMTGESLAAVIEGRPGTVHSGERCRGAREALERHGKSVVVRAAYFEREKAVEAASLLLKEYTDLRTFFCANDMMALGVADICSLHGVRASIVGVDGIPDALDAIRGGTIDGSVSFSPTAVAHCVVNAMAAFFAYEESLCTERVDSFLVTKDNVDNYGL